MSAHSNPWQTVNRTTVDYFDPLLDSVYPIGSVIITVAVGATGHQIIGAVAIYGQITVFCEMIVPDDDVQAAMELMLSEGVDLINVKCYPPDNTDGGLHDSLGGGI